MTTKGLLIASAIMATITTGCCNSPKNNEVKTENPVIEAIMARRSIRKYKDTPVEREKLQQIAVCGVNAPNGMNAQTWEVRIVDNPQTISKITDIFKNLNPQMAENDPSFKNMFRNAPAVIAIAVPEGDSGINAGLMGENMILAAESLGLGTCCLGGPVAFLKNTPEAAWFMDGLKLSEGYELLYMIAVGYPDETPDAKARDLGKIMFID